MLACHLVDEISSGFADEASFEFIPAGGKATEAPSSLRKARRAQKP